MDYACAEAKMGNVKATEPVESLTDMMKQTNIIAADVLAMARRINGHLFGNENQGCEKEAAPSCFREELARARQELLETAEELNKMSYLLGL